MITIDKMFEYDFGIDYNDTASTINERAKQYRAKKDVNFRKQMEEQKKEREKNTSLSLWAVLINEDILDKA